MEGFDEVEWLIIDDGSTDNTVQVARENGVNHVVSFPRNKGLARGFMAGIAECLRQGADVIVNTDADNQYVADDIPKLVKPILMGEADYVVGTRPIMNIEHFSLLKKMLQKLGSWVVRKLSKTDIPDATSGFRAISREAALSLNVFNEYTYTLETIIQAGQKNMAIRSVDVRVNGFLRPSRLMKSMYHYITRNLGIMLRIFVVYRPFYFFFLLGFLLFLAGFALGVRYLVYYFMGDGAGHMQSVVLAGVLLGMGFQTFLVAFLAQLLSVNRKLLEDVQIRLRKVEAGEPASNSPGAAVVTSASPAVGKKVRRKKKKSVGRKKV